MSRQALLSLAEIEAKKKTIIELLKTKNSHLSQFIVTPWFFILSDSNVDRLLQVLTDHNIHPTLQELNDKITEGAYQGATILYYLIAVAPFEALISNNFERILKLTDAIITFILSCDEYHFMKLLQLLSHKMTGDRAFDFAALYHLTQSLAMAAKNNNDCYEKISAIFECLIAKCDHNNLAIFIKGIDFSALFDAVKNKPDLQEKIIFRVFKKLRQISKIDMDQEAITILCQWESSFRDMLQKYLKNINEADQLEQYIDKDKVLGVLIDCQWRGWITSSSRFFVNNQVCSLRSSESNEFSALKNLSLPL